MNQDVLYQIIKDRINSSPSGSYVAGLVQKGITSVTQKVGEEAVETVIAALKDSEQRLIEEMADLWFHSLVLLAAKNIDPEKVWQELSNRHQSKNA
ncbi:MAG: phosphoribosyl-ATP diphosphatase [Patescibacteria group bacterium]|jgi:phosphoribosyl-ATP pyrophosphohydrolase